MRPDLYTTIGVTEKKDGETEEDQKKTGLEEDLEEED